MKKEKLPARRIRVLVAIMALWGIGIGARLYFLQVVQSADYIEKAAQHQQQTSSRSRLAAATSWIATATCSPAALKVDSVFASPMK